MNKFEKIELYLAMFAAYVVYSGLCAYVYDLALQQMLVDTVFFFLCGWTAGLWHSRIWEAWKRAYIDEPVPVSTKRLEYSLVFMFDKNLDNVLLIKKNRPAWQAGRLNGIGGKVETGETAIGCAVRELAEETGIVVSGEAMRRIGVVAGAGWYMTVYAFVYDGFQTPKTMTAEEVSWHRYDDVMDRRSGPHTVVDNIYWLLPMCRNNLDRALSEATECDVRYDR